MHKLIRKLLGKLSISCALVMAVLITSGFGTINYVLASSTTNFLQVINAGSLSVDIVDGSYAPVSNPGVDMDTATFSFACQTTTGAFGTASEQIYVKNPDAADNGWVVSLAASSVAAVWDGAASDFDFNDPGGSGCTDTVHGNDTDTVGGQMTVNPSVGTLAKGVCASCNTNNITKGSSAAFDAVNATPVNSITILTGAINSDDIGDWKLTGVSISQKIPAEQASASDYEINLVLSII